MALNILAMTERRHQAVMNHLFPGDGLEAAAILLCNQGTGKQLRRLIVTDVLFPAHNKSKRKKDFVAWPFSECLSPEKITDIDRSGQSIVTIHSHPNGCDQFSVTDDRNDRELFPSVCNWFDDGRPNGSAIMLENGTIVARTVDTNGTFVTFSTVSVVGDNIRIWKPNKPLQLTAYQAKQVQTFGRGTLELLRSMRVGVVGCSGTGSIIIELLVRNCIGELTIVDNDTVAEKNLNRLINSTKKQARNQQPKVFAIKDTLLKIGMETKVNAYQGLTDSPEVVSALIDCDVIFGCVDSAFGRYHLDCLSSAYLIPYFDVGVHLETDGKGGLSAADAVSHYIHPEGESLLSRGAYSMEQVTAENWKRDDPAYYKQQLVAGYLASVGEDQPAVMSLNMQAACMAFNDFLARIHHYRFDKNCEFATQRFRLVHGCYENSVDENVPHQLLKRYMEAGDSSLLVKNNTKHV